MKTPAEILEEIADMLNLWANDANCLNDKGEFKDQKVDRLFTQITDALAKLDNLTDDGYLID